MTDSTFSWVTVAIWVIALAAYRLRVARLGTFGSERVRTLGGTALVGENVMKATYWAIEPVVRRLVALGITANVVTSTALVLGLCAAVAIGAGWFGVACLLATVSTICDVLDGQVARVTGASSSGALLDSVVDRYTEFGFIAGFIVYAHQSVGHVVVALAALLASFMSSYTSAKADAFSIETPRGLMRRHERAVFLILGAGLTPILGPTVEDRWPSLAPAPIFVLGLLIVSVVGNVAAVQRLSWISRQLRDAEKRSRR